MKVKELIKELQKLDQEMPVVAEDYAGHEGIGVVTAESLKIADKQGLFPNMDNMNIIEGASLFMCPQTLTTLVDGGEPVDVKTLVLGIYDYEDGEVQGSLSVVDDDVEYFNKDMKQYLTDIPESKEEEETRIKHEKAVKRQELLEKQAEIEKELDELNNN